MRKALVICVMLLVAPAFAATTPAPKPKPTPVTIVPPLKPPIVNVAPIVIPAPLVNVNVPQAKVCPPEVWQMIIGFSLFGNAK